MFKVLFQVCVICIACSFSGFGQQSSASDKIKKYKEVLESQSASKQKAEALYNLGVVYDSLGQRKKAIDNFRKLLYEYNNEKEVCKKVLKFLKKPGSKVSVKIENLHAKDVFKIVIPQITFSNTTLEQTLETFKRSVKELDPAKKGLNIIHKIDTDQKDKPSAKKTINLSFKNISTEVCLKYICLSFGINYSVEPFSVIVGSAKSIQTLETRFYHISPQYLPLEMYGDNGLNIEELKKIGLTFPEGSSINLIERVQRLVMTNVKENHEIMEYFLSKIKEYMEPKQIKFHAEIVEVKDNSKILDLNTGLINEKLLRSLGEDQVKTITELDVITQTGNTVIAEDMTYVNLNGNREPIGHILELTPQILPSGNSIEAECKWFYSAKLKNGSVNHLCYDSRSYFNVGSSSVIQVSQADGQGRKNLYLVLTGNLIDHQGQITKQ